MKFNSILKIYILLYIGYMIGAQTSIYDINIISVIFYMLLSIKMFVLIHNETNK